MSFFEPKNAQRSFDGEKKRTATPVIYDASPSLKILIRSLYDVLVGSSENTDKNILDKSYELVKHIPDFLLWEYRIA